MLDSTLRMAQKPKSRMDLHARAHLYQKGLAAFNSGHFYEAHEHWEEVWLETPNPDKMFLQGLIQVAAAFHHHSRANRKGTRNLLHAGLLKLEYFPRVHGGLEIEALRESVRSWLAALNAGQTPAHSNVPRIDPAEGLLPSI
jgi:hypothetical protein